MALGKFALYSFDGATSYALDRSWPYLWLPPAVWAWRHEPVDEALDGAQVYGLYKAVTWDFVSDVGPYRRGIPIGQHDFFGSLRQANGQIRFETKNNLGQWVVCVGVIDRIIAATFDRQRTRARGVKVEFTRVVEVA